MLQESLKVAKLSPKEHVPKKFYKGSEVPKFIAYKVMIIKHNVVNYERQQEKQLLAQSHVLSYSFECNKNPSGAQLGPIFTTCFLSLPLSCVICEVSK